LPLLNLSLKHGRTLDDARARLKMAVGEAQARFSPMIQRVEWSADQDSVALSGVGFRIEMRVDAQDVHVTGDLPLFGGLLGSPLAQGLKGILQKAFTRQLT
jgi:hypothetical protein